MTHGDGEPGRRIRIRVTGDDPQDLEALYRWLKLEEWFAQAEAARELTVEQREYDGVRPDAEERPDGPSMGGVLSELVLVIAGAAVTPVFEDLYNRAKIAAHAWADNSSSADHPMVTDVQADDADEEPEDDEGGRNT
ncbi:hypothetical protein [Streptomyces sp. CBMA29]|uniref:hypothetical protein n=1 Tax=Streptomyces sp. CBMA29 TaxID=1896314 RepID=UPI0016620EE4|nr:hypothetical protein [Streptomyces sp. CBMA29]MBD0740365.1 hypothetical protein [Streptomyces sp. CBMA29]